VRTLLENPKSREKQLASAFQGLAMSAAYNVIAIDDAQETTEVLQESILSSLSAGKFRNPTLVWRSVLAVLSSIETGLLRTEQMVGIISHAPDGVTVQKLRLRKARGRSEELLTPERRQIATLVPGDIGYRSLVERSRIAVIGPTGFSAQTAHLALSRSVGRIALGLPRQSEMMRRHNGDWDKVSPIEGNFIPERFFTQAFPSLSDCSVVLLETLVEGHVRQALKEQINGLISGEVVLLPSDVVARGALVAAQRFSEGDPAYFDFLPRLSTIVFGKEGAENFDLVDENETLEAGRVYRSPKPAEFAIPEGHSSVSVYLDKEAETHPRKATVKLDARLRTPVPVSLWVEQKPAAGRARIMLDAPSLGRQFTVDWEKAEEDARSWEEIIASLETQPPSVPARLILKCGIIAWKDGSRGPGLLTLLETEGGRTDTDWDSYAERLSARPFGEYCISSDGALPQEISEHDTDRLKTLTNAALDLTKKRLLDQHREPNDSNAALKFLTWQFRRCPEEVGEWLMDCIESRGLAMFAHPFVRRGQSWPLIFQGLARIAKDKKTERRTIKMLLSTPVSSWNWRVESACMAILLSRSDTAPQFLERDDVEKLARRVIIDFRANLGQEYTKFYYAPFLLAGLLRWRLKEPRGILLGKDPIANSLAGVIKEVQQDLMNRQQLTTAFERRRDKYLPILADLASELEGVGTNPDLLLNIYGDGV
jgi:hypothetical protein